MANQMNVFVCRKQGEAEICPFKGPFSFTYAKGGAGAICSYPRSYMDSCQDPTKLQLSFQVGEDVDIVCSYPRSYLDSCQDPTKLQLSFQV
jgi:hypothetical protein